MYNERFGSQSGQIENVCESVGTLTDLLWGADGFEDSLGENVGTPIIYRIHEESREIIITLELLQSIKFRNQSFVGTTTKLLVSRTYKETTIRKKGLNQPEKTLEYFNSFT